MYVCVCVCVCVACECDGIGSLERSCDVTTGQCRCRRNYGGRSCAACGPGYYDYPACQRTYVSTTTHTHRQRTARSLVVVETNNLVPSCPSVVAASGFIRP